MKYLLINQETKEETLCNKVVIEGYEYYTEDGSVVKPINFSKWQYQKPNILFKGMDNMQNGEVYEIIATNNPSIDIHKVIDEVEEIANCVYPIDAKYKETYKTDYTVFNICFKEGYAKHEETNPYSVNDMIEFGKFCNNDAHSVNRIYSFTELFDIWEQQRTKTIYFK